MGRRNPFGIEWLPSRGALNILQCRLHLITTNQGLSIDKKTIHRWKQGYNGTTAGTRVLLMWKLEREKDVWSKRRSVLCLSCSFSGCGMKSPLLICSPLRLHQVLKVRNFCFVGLYRFPEASSPLKSEVLLELLSSSTDGCCHSGKPYDCAVQKPS